MQIDISASFSIGRLSYNLRFVFVHGVHFAIMALETQYLVYRTLDALYLVVYYFAKPEFSEKLIISNSLRRRMGDILKARRVRGGCL